MVLNLRRNAGGGQPLRNFRQCCRKMRDNHHALSPVPHPGRRLAQRAPLGCPRQKHAVGLSPQHGLPGKPTEQGHGGMSNNEIQMMKE
jgi:hypothetical protein